MAITNASRVADFGSGIGTEGAVLQVDNTNNRLGIGTTNPQAMLQVGTAVTVHGNSGIVSATSYYGSGSNLTDITAGGLSGSPNITINNLVGVAATFSGVVTYEDVTNIDSVGIITAQSYVSIADSIVHTGDIDTSLRFPANDTFTVETAGSERLRIDSSGNLGIGGTATNYSDHKTLSIFGATNTGAGLIEFNDTSGNADAAIFADGGNLFINADYDNTSTDSTIRFRVDGSSEKMRIDSSGRVGINTTTFADTATALAIKNGSSGSDHTLLDIVCDTNETARVRFSEDGSTFPGEIRYNTLGHELQFYVNSGPRMQIDSSGDVEIIDGDLVIGTAGHGIDFSAQTATSATGATTNSELLDHYEEGAWSPDFFGLSSAFTSYHNKKGTFVRIGSVCHINGFIQLNGTPAFTSPNDYLRLGPLPFAASNQGGGYYYTVGSLASQGFNWHDNDYQNTGQIACGVQNHNGIYYVIFQASGNNNTRGVVQNSAVGSLNPIIEFQLTYRV